MDKKTNLVSLELKNVYKSYGKHGETEVLKNVNLKMEGGHVYGLVAPNGAGKSTLMKCCVNLCFFSGEILYNNQPVGTHLNAQIIYAPDVAIFNDSELTVLQYLQRVAIMKDLDYLMVLKRLQESLLSSFAGTQCRGLSTGWKKVLQIFTENLTDPQVMLLDEPFNGLDQQFKTIVAERILSLAAEGRIIIISTHVFSELEGNTTSVFALKNGYLHSNEGYQGSIVEFYTDLFSDQKKEKLF